MLIGRPSLKQVASIVVGAVVSFTYFTAWHAYQQVSLTSYPFKRLAENVGVNRQTESTPSPSFFGSAFRAPWLSRSLPVSTRLFHGASWTLRLDTS
jgi:hypothetical protein